MAAFNLSPWEWYFFCLGVLVGINIPLAVAAFQAVRGVQHAKAGIDSPVVE